MIKKLLLAFCLAVSIPSSTFAGPTEFKVTITVAGKTLTATFLDNATTRHLITQFPLKLPMMDLYSREMCYRFPTPLPAEEAGISGYQVGDIAYWTPRHSFVIFYEQNGEVISNLQKIGNIDFGSEVFRGIGNIDVTFDISSN